MERPFQLDIEKEKVFYDNEWLNTQQLSEKIRRMIDHQDFRIGSAGMALEYLQHSLRHVKNFTIRLFEEDARVLERQANRAGVSPASFLRQALQAYLVALPPLEPLTPASATTGTQLPPLSITTEPAGPEEAGQAVELKSRKTDGSAKVLVDPSLASGFEGEWFKRPK